jgi:hypothetical protein
MLGRIDLNVYARLQLAEFKHCKLEPKKRLQRDRHLRSFFPQVRTSGLTSFLLLLDYIEPNWDSSERLFELMSGALKSIDLTKVKLSNKVFFFHWRLVLSIFWLLKWPFWRPQGPRWISVGLRCRSVVGFIMLRNLCVCSWFHWKLLTLTISNLQCDLIGDHNCHVELVSNVVEGLS